MPPHFSVRTERTVLSALAESGSPRVIARAKAMVTFNFTNNSNEKVKTKTEEWFAT
jgi:hypothetical protein